MHFILGLVCETRGKCTEKVPNEKIKKNKENNTWTYFFSLKYYMKGLINK